MGNRISKTALLNNGSDKYVVYVFTSETYNSMHAQVTIGDEVIKLPHVAFTKDDLLATRAMVIEEVLAFYQSHLDHTRKEPERWYDPTHESVVLGDMREELGITYNCETCCDDPLSCVCVEEEESIGPAYSSYASMHGRISGEDEIRIATMDVDSDELLTLLNTKDPNPPTPTG